MTGWRVGYTLADAALIKEMSKIQGQATSNICSIAQKAAVRALTGSYECVDNMRTAFMRRRDMAHQKFLPGRALYVPSLRGLSICSPT